ncbi:hypothetical protein BTM25_34530 [Actinomadura rubteroloni]|uniref:Uncharacterized protein n=1 Tax=Actinomadura rubteroloni TaxID=1926885 RepID=A0A2P4UIC3_9ACTN|nr:hypothetical protein [Actinomadura rubteroloni]POM24815.1 hypothetical protein BTM25_34530 [Actinomadura rubteroloni]
MSRDDLRTVTAGLSAFGRFAAEVVHGRLSVQPTVRRLLSRSNERPR